MAAGTELDKFHENLSISLTDIRTIRTDGENFGDALKTAATASQGYLAFRKIIKVTEAGVSAAVTVLKLSENVAPLKGPSKTLKEVLEVIQPKIVKIKEQTDKAKKLEPLLDAIVKAEDEYSDKVLPVLISADLELTNIFSGITEVVDAFDRVSTPDGIPELNPNAGTSRPGKDEFTSLFDEVDDFVAPVNVLAGPAQKVGDAYDTARATLVDVFAKLDVIDFPSLNEIFGDLVDFDGLFDILGGILEAVELALLPIQPLLSAVDAVASAVVDPVVDYLIEQIRADEIFEEMAALLEPLIPDITLFDGFLEAADAFEALLDKFAIDLFEMPAIVDRAFEAYDRFEQTIEDTELAALSIIDGVPVRIGDAEKEVMYGTGGDEVFDAREGDDTILANSGNDIIVASAGDDVIKGGFGIDRVVFAGELAEYDFARDEDTGAFIFTHTLVGQHGYNEGTEIITEVEFFDFGTETFTKEQFDNAVVGQSVLDGNGPPGARTTNNDELIFLNSGGSLINGLVLNGKTFNGVNVVDALGGDDRIHGTLGDDFIIAGAGNDLIVPRGGDDAVDGGSGNDTFQVFNIGPNNTHFIDLEDGTSRRSGERVELFAVENTITQHGGSTALFGTADTNVLFTGAGRDLIFGRDGDDRLFGNASEDGLFGGLGVDRLRGGDGSDFLAAWDYSDEGSAELYDGEGGGDWLVYATGTAGLDALDDFANGKFDALNLRTDQYEANGSGGRVVIRAKDGEVDRLDAQGNIIATDIARNIETYVGSNGADTLFGDGEADYRLTIDGGPGNDVIHTWGADEINGGRGSDVFIVERDPAGGAFAQAIDGGPGARDYDIVDMRQAGDSRFIVKTNGVNRFEVVVASKDFFGPPLSARGSDFTVKEVQEFILGDNDDYFQWGTGSDGTVYGGKGNDYLISSNQFGQQLPVFQGGDGNDTIVLEDGGAAFGDEGDDRIEVHAGGKISAEGGGGNDTFYITRMEDRVAGGFGYDRLIINPHQGEGLRLNLFTGIATSDNYIFLDDITDFEEFVTSDARDTVTASNDGDRLILRGGNDTSTGGDGDDQMFGGDGNDSLEGREGNDFLHGGLGNDTLSGNAGTDTIDYSFAAPGGAEGEIVAQGFAAVTVNLSNERAESGGFVDRLNSIENVYGSPFSDHITGDNRANLLSGGVGQDTLIGGAGDDTLIAGTSIGTQFEEELHGGEGDDLLLPGVDRFEAFGGSGFDTLDFSIETDPGTRGGKSIEIDIDLHTRRLSRDVEFGEIVWADDGSSSFRMFEGQRVLPQDVYRKNPFYALSQADNDRNLPDGDEDDDSLPSFAVEIETRERSSTNEITEISSIEGVRGTIGNDTIRGNDDNNVLEGTDGDDLLEGRGGNDSLDGGEGEDTAYFSGDQSFYTVVLGDFGGGFSTFVRDRRTDENGGALLRDVELIDFDSDLFGDAMDLRSFGAAAGLAADDLKTLIELYIAYFNRAPDAVGLNFWGSAFANGTTLAEMAALFIDQDETRATYPAGQDIETFVSSVYNNVLGRIPDQLGFDFWVDVLESGSLTRDVFILEVLKGAKRDATPDDPADLAAQLAIDRQYLEDKTDIGTYFAVNRGMSDVENAKTAMQLYNGSQTSIDAAVEAIDGFFDSALTSDGTEFLIQILGVLDDPFAG